MAKPAKRRVPGSTGPSAGSTTGGSDGDGDRPAVVSRRVTPAGSGSGDRASGSARRVHRPSPRWVPILMFALWGLGLLVIILNYMQILPGAEDGGNGWYLVGGLASILGGIIVATQYH